MPIKMVPPSKDELEMALGAALPIWNEVIHAAEQICIPITQTWKPSKTGFGGMCLLQHKQRTLLYLTPDTEMFWVAIILGERAFQLAMSSPLPDSIKKLFVDAKPYAEGRGIRIAISSHVDVQAIADLLKIKTTPP